MPTAREEKQVSKKLNQKHFVPFCTQPVELFKRKFVRYILQDNFNFYFGLTLGGKKTRTSILCNEYCREKNL